MRQLLKIYFTMGVFDAVVAVLLTAVAMELGRGGKNDWIILVGGH